MKMLKLVLALLYTSHLSSMAEDGIVLKLSPERSEVRLSIALSTLTSEKPVPTYLGVRIVSDVLPTNGESALFGFRNGDGKTHVKLPEQKVVLSGKTYTCMLADMDRRENGMFSVIKDEKTGKYKITGIFSTYEHLFIIDHALAFDEELPQFELAANLVAQKAADDVKNARETQAGKNPNQPTAQAAETNKPDAQLWPPPLDEKRLIGIWVRKDAPVQGVENHTLLVLREDHSWYEAEISGPLTEPVRFKKFATTSKWEVVNVGEQNTQTSLLFKQKEGGSNVWNILKVGAEELDTSGFGPTIIDLRHYTRCDAQTAAKLNERLNQKETEPTAK